MIVLLLLLYLEGIVACFSPCGLAIIPTYLSYLAGLEQRPWHALGTGTAFAVGVSTTMALLGALASVLGLIIPPLAVTYAVLGAVMIVCGVAFIIYVQRYACEYPAVSELSHYSGTLGALVLGLTFGAAGTTCVTPILAGVLFLIAPLRNILLGASVLFLFGIGYGTPLIILSPLVAKGHTLAGARFAAASRWISRIAGLVLIVLGVDLLLPLFGFPSIILGLLTGL